VSCVVLTCVVLTCVVLTCDSWHALCSLPTSRYPYTKKTKWDYFCCTKKTRVLLFLSNKNVRPSPPIKHPLLPGGVAVARGSRSYPQPPRVTKGLCLRRAWTSSLLAQEGAVLPRVFMTRICSRDGSASTRRMV
jgi:hypothetical protein